MEMISVSIRRTNKARIIAWALIAVFMLNGGLALAQSYDPDQAPPKPTLFEKRLNKFGRGLSNFFLGWAEVPKTINQKHKRGKSLSYLITTAPLIGTVKAFIRTGIGVKEVFTFTRTPPDLNYEAIIEPEYIF